MGIGFTIDTPIKVSKFGIDSVVSLVDDSLIENLRKMYCEKYNLPYKEISNKEDDFRAERIKAYLNLMQDIASKKFEELKEFREEKREEFHNYLKMLPESSSLKNEFKKLSDRLPSTQEVKNWLNENLSMGSIDVNIMTKVDKDNFKKGEKLDVEFNDAHAALRGFASSNLSSSLILSAGMNPRLYSYMEKFQDFFPKADGSFVKKIVLKVSDFKSAMIQGKFLAKKGLWVSEFRVESGLNCGGHAFATEGLLMGPILEEFKKHRSSLRDSLLELYLPALNQKQKKLPDINPNFKISAQGGVGTAEEHDFLIEHYGVDSVGWGSPLMLVPEAVSIDNDSIHKLEKAKEEDLYLSNISPLGIPFNSLKGNTKDIEKDQLIKEGLPGSKCTKRYAALDYTYSEKGLCTASKTYQNLRIKDLKEQNLSDEEFKKEYDKIVTKSCTCVGLGTSTLLCYNLDTSENGDGVSICPGPNIAYFDKQMTLGEITDHIYGRENVISRNDRPNMFVKELNIYIDHLKEKADELKEEFNRKKEKSFNNFSENLKEGINYYQGLFDEMKDKFQSNQDQIKKELEAGRVRLQNLMNKGS
jgi:tRNA-dihydrouridine synthase